MQVENIPRWLVILKELSRSCWEGHELREAGKGTCLHSKPSPNDLRAPLTLMPLCGGSCGGLMLADGTERPLVLVNEFFQADSPHPQDLELGPGQFCP